jgi:hypothetical protein
MVAPAEAHFGNGQDPMEQVAQARFPNTCQPVDLGNVHHEMPGASLAWADTANCKVWLSRKVWLSPTFHGHSWRWRCTYLVHEYGHLAGRAHVFNSTSIMFAAPMLHGGCRR